MSGLPPGQLPPPLDQLFNPQTPGYGAIAQALIQIAGALSHVGAVLAPPSGTAGGDLAGNFPNPTVTATHLTAPLPLLQGGTDNTTGQPSGTAGGDLGGTYPNPLVTQTHLTIPLPPSQGGTGNTGGTGPPTGAAGGDLAGTYPSPLVEQINGNPVAVGSWTPTLQFGGASVSITYASRPGQYVRIGQLVVASFLVNLTSKGVSAGVATITGLPFTCGALNGVVVIGSHGNLATSNVFECSVVAGTVTISLGKGNATSSSALIDTDFNNNTAIQGVATYIAA